MILVTPIEWYGLAALLVVCLLAVWRGGKPERKSAAIVAICWVASIIVDNDGSTGVQWGILGIDILLAGWLIAQALTATQAWSFVAAGAQILIVLTHVGFALTPEMMQEGFFSAYYIWSYVVLLALAFGSLTTRRPRLDDRRQQKSWL
ncbi:MAG: hypothetical protein DCF29_14780 [Alphaproteobacteria bacterium]|nr:MAG: hypothetical protein DCF29_14780 [Alphaproteobacteria bacterium]